MKNKIKGNPFGFQGLKMGLRPDVVKDSKKALEKLEQAIKDGVFTNQKSLDKKKTLRSICKDERYCYWYLCPSCLEGAIGDGDRFCANCGLNLKDYKFIHDKI